MQTPKTEAVFRNLEHVRCTFAVASGKGGVGKSTVSLALAQTLARKGYSVGILDADIHGPNIPAMLGVDDQVFETAGDRVIPIRVSERICIASVACIGYDRNAALIWRGPMKLSMIRQFLESVEWNALDVLIIDTPPGTGDEVLTIAEYLPTLSGWIVVTTPQNISLQDARRSIDFARQLNLPIFGVIENMCDSDTIQLFGSNGGKTIAEEYSIPLLGSIAIMPELARYTEEGKIMEMIFPENIDSICENIIQYCT